MSQWIVKSASTTGEEGTRELDKLLRAGWEPFAVVRGVMDGDIVYLRTYGKVREQAEQKFVLGDGGSLEQA